MSPQLFVMVLVIILLVMASYSNSRLRNKILCEYTNRSDQSLEKFVSLKSSYIIFEGKRFLVIPACHKLFWYTRGIHQFFPTWVIKYSYSWESELPQDPNTGKPVVLSPDNRNAINQEARFGAYARAQQQVSGKKQSGMTQYLPWIAVALGAVAVFLVYSQGQHIKLLEQLAGVGK